MPQPGRVLTDSGVTPWHDDLTVANRAGQRVTAFVDFVNNRTAKYYRITTAGRRRLNADVVTWHSFMAAAARALSATNPVPA